MDEGWAVDTLDLESCQVPARDDHPGQAAPTGTAVVSDGDDLFAAVAPLGRQDPYFGAGREMFLVRGGPPSRHGRARFPLPMFATMRKAARLTASC
jgi:hypothetical protein